MPLGTKVGLIPGDSVLDRDPAPLPTKGVEPLLNFGPFLLWRNGCIHQDATWYGGRPRPGDFVFDWDSAPSPKRGRSPQFSAHVSCGQMAAWIKMPRRLYVTWGSSAPPQKGGKAPLPNFRPMSTVAQRMDESRWHLAWRWALVHATLC